MKISAVVIAFNEEKKIGDAIRSVAWADEILVVDSESTDATREIAENLGAKVLVRKWEGFASQKQFATEAAANDWILSLDADERVSPELRNEIEQIRSGDSAADGYRIPRLSVYMGRKIRHSGWYPDRQLRFFDRRKGRWKDVAVHESVTMNDGAVVENLSGDLFHYSVDSPSHHAEMIQTRYAPLSAKAMFDAGKTSSAAKIAFLPILTFLRTYIVKAGFLDGLPGIIIAYFAAYNVLLKNLLLYEMQQNKDAKPSDN